MIEKYKKYMAREYSVLDDEKRAIKNFNLPKNKILKIVLTYLILTH
jgi:hypothetical protein